MVLVGGLQLHLSTSPGRASVWEEIKCRNPQAKVIRERVSGWGGGLEMGNTYTWGKTSKGHIYSDVYCAPTNQSGTFLFPSPGGVLRELRRSRLGLTCRSLPFPGKPVSGWRSTAKSTDHRGAARRAPRARGLSVPPGSEVLQDSLQGPGPGTGGEQGHPCG